MSLTRRTLLFALAFAAAPWAAAAQDGPLKFEGLSFDRQLRLAGADLVLNGAGLRSVAWFKGFVAALWMASRAHDPAQVTAVPGPKRLQLCIFWEVGAVEFAKAFRKGVARNAAGPDEVARLEARMQTFEGLVNGLETVRKGDVINLDFVPGQGTLFSVNGKLHGSPIAGEDFYAALLRAFVGDLPYDPKLKAGLLGRNA
jgi:hypothetical protein